MLNGYLVTVKIRPEALTLDGLYAGTFNPFEFGQEGDRNHERPLCVSSGRSLQWQVRVRNRCYRYQP